MSANFCVTREEDREAKHAGVAAGPEACVSLRALDDGCW
jgi:hypothetical protein